MPNDLGKPPHVFGREREWKALADFAADPRQEATLGIVSGRRRQGKTYLLRSLAAATGGFFFEAAEATEAESLRMFGAALARHAGSAADFSFPDWENALIKRLDRKEFDEIVLRAGAAFGPAVFQAIIRNYRPAEAVDKYRIYRPRASTRSN